VPQLGGALGVEAGAMPGPGAAPWFVLAGELRVDHAAEDERAVPQCLEAMKLGITRPRPAPPDGEGASAPRPTGCPPDLPALPLGPETPALRSLPRTRFAASQARALAFVARSAASSSRGGTSQ